MMKFVLVFLISLFFVQIAYAQTQGESIQIVPTFQTLNISDQTASVSGKVALTNVGSVDQRFTVFAVDIQQFDVDGRVILSDKPRSGEAYSLAEFIAFDSNSIVLPAKGTVEVPFYVKNSASLSPGGHYAAVVARLEGVVQSTQQQVLPALSSFVLVHKEGGERYHLSLTNEVFPTFFIQPTLPQKAMLSFSNQGNTHVIPRGTVEVTDLFGRVVRRGIINENSVFVMPGTQREMQTALYDVKQQFPIMLYSEKIVGHSVPGDVSFSQSSSVLVIHPLMVLVPVSLIGIGIWKRRRRKHR